VTEEHATPRRVGRRPSPPPLPPLMGHYPTKGRQPAYESNVSASLCARQTPEMFGGVSTD